jgi:hypothetical protein
VYQSLITLTVVFIAHSQSVKRPDPGNHSFDDSSARVSTHPSAILTRGAFAILSIRRNEQKVSICHFIPEFIPWVSLIRYRSEKRGLGGFYEQIVTKGVTTFVDTLISSPALKVLAWG